MGKVHNGGRGQEGSKVRSGFLYQGAVFGETRAGTGGSVSSLQHGHHNRTCRERFKPFNSNRCEVKRQMNASHEKHFSKGVRRPYAMCWE